MSKKLSFAEAIAWMTANPGREVMSKENKGARQWTLYGDHFEHPNGYKIKEIPVLKIESGPNLNADEKVKVIEYTAYEKAQIEIKELKEYLHSSVDFDIHNEKVKALEQRLAEAEKQLAIAVEEQKQMRKLIQDTRDLCEARFRPGAGISDDALSEIVGKVEEVYRGK